MKKLEYVEKKNYLTGGIRWIPGYWKKGWIVQGYDSFGPVGILCHTEKQAKNLIDEINYEDSYARVFYKRGRMFIELDSETIYKKRMAREEIRNFKPQKEYRCLWYGWDGTIIETIKATNTSEFNNLIRYMVAGDKLAYKDEHNDLHVITCEYKNPSKIYKGDISLIYKSTTNGLPDIIEE